MRSVLALACLGVASALVRLNGGLQGVELKPGEVNQDGQPVFYAIVMNQAAQKHQVRLWLSSLRQVGQWKGAVVLVTDKPECLTKNLGRELLGQKTEGDENVDIYSGAGGTKLHIVKVAPTENVREMKFQKAKAWENVDLARISHPVSSVVYVDMDVVMAKGLQDFIPYVRALENDGHTIAVFRDTGVTGDYEQGKPTAIHTGVVIIFRGEATAKCMAKWGELLLTEPSMAELLAKDPHLMDNVTQPASLLQVQASMQGPDQRALTKSEPCQEAKGIKLMDEKFFFFPPMDRKIEGAAEFVHFTNSRRWKHITAENLEDYLYDQLGLSRDLDVLNEEQC